MFCVVALIVTVLALTILIPSYLHAREGRQLLRLSVMRTVADAATRYQKEFGNYPSETAIIAYDSKVASILTDHESWRVPMVKYHATTDSATIRSLGSDALDPGDDLILTLPESPVPSPISDR